MRSSWRAGRREGAGGGAARRRAARPGPGSATTRARATCTPARRRWPAEHGGRFPGHRGRLARAARHRRLYGGGDRGDRVRPPRGGDRRQYRAGDRAAVTRSRAELPAAKAEIRARAETLVPRTPRRRFHAGDDGPRRHHLHAEEAGLRHLPVDGRVCSARARGDAETFPRKAPKVEGKMRHGASFVVDARRRSRAGAHAAEQGIARRHDRGAVDGVGARVRRGRRARRRRRSRRNGASCPAWSSTASRIFRCGRRSMSRSVPAKTKAPAGMRWVSLAELHGEALPNVMRKVVAHAGLCRSLRRDLSR